MNKESLKHLKIGSVLENVSLKEYTTYKLNGIARFLVIPDNLDCLKKLINYLNENKIKYKIIGGGSNLIFKNKIYDGVLILLKKNLHMSAFYRNFAG